MVIDFDIQRCTRRCAATERALEPGEIVYSALIHQEGREVRVDYCQQGWKEPPEDATAWWKHQLPSPDDKKKNWAPHEVMLDYFERLESQPDKKDARYVMALLLIRRRLLKWEDSETNEEGVEQMVLICPSNDCEYRVALCEPAPQRIEQIQQELATLLQ